MLIIDAKIDETKISFEYSSNIMVPMPLLEWH